MKKLILFSLFLALSLSTVSAQDDMYFVPKKKSKETKKETPVYNYRDVDEYNRHGAFRSSYKIIGTDSLANDVIDFEQGGYADSLAVYGGGGYSSENDYACTRNMSRFDGYYWHSPWHYSYYDPWFYGSGWWYSRYGWYDPWCYDPWYYGGWYGWHRPWYGWHYPHYWGGVSYRPYRGVTGTSNHGKVNYGNRGSNNKFRGYRGDRNNNRNDNSGFRDNRRDNNFNDFSRPSYNNNSSFGGNRGGSFGGNRGGGSFGGSRGGGGSFGGRR